MASLVYKITFPNGKVYVGQTSCTLEARKSDHEYDSTYKKYAHLPLYKAINKYGKDTLVWEVLIDNLSDEAANIWEQHYITLSNSSSKDKGYNRTSGGKKHFRHSDETKELISKKIKEHSQIYWQDPKRREKSATITKKTWEDLGIRAKRSEAIKKVRSSEEQRKITSEDNKKRYQDPEKLKAMAIAVGAKPFYVYSSDGTFVGEWLIANQCARDLKFKTSSHISNCLCGRSKSYCGYTFKYKSEIINENKMEEKL